MRRCKSFILLNIQWNHSVIDIFDLHLLIKILWSGGMSKTPPKIIWDQGCFGLMRPSRFQNLISPIFNMAAGCHLELRKMNARTRAKKTIRYGKVATKHICFKYIYSYVENLDVNSRSGRITISNWRHVMFVFVKLNYLCNWE